MLVELDHGHEAVPAAPNTGVNTLTGEGLAKVVTGAAVVVDVSNSPSFEDAPVLKFFETSTTNLHAAEETAGVGHHVALSVVGSDRMPDSGYLRAKVAQRGEALLQRATATHGRSRRAIRGLRLEQLHVIATSSRVLTLQKYVGVRVDESRQDRGV